MPFVRFTADPVLPIDWRNRPYKKDYECELTDSEAERFINAGVAMVIPPGAAASLARAALGPGGRARPRAGDEDSISGASALGSAGSGSGAAMGELVGSTGGFLGSGGVVSGGTVGSAGTVSGAGGLGSGGVVSGGTVGSAGTVSGSSMSSGSGSSSSSTSGTISGRPDV